jgi:hypothetical protein
VHSTAKRIDNPEGARPPVRSRSLDRLAAAFLLILMAIGSLTLWIGVPVAVLWALARVTDSSAHHFVLGLIGVPLAMALFAPLLLWTNALYLRVTGGYTAEEEDEPPRRLRGPLEPILAACFVAALVALSVWFFVFAENPPRQFI